MPARSVNTLIACGMAMSMAGTIGVAAAASPGDDELAALRQQVTELQQRIEALEARLDGGASIEKSDEIQPIAGGWRAPHNWELLEKGMSYHRLKAILGEPDATRRIGKHQVWRYPNGEVKLYLRRVTSWTQ